MTSSAAKWSQWQVGVVNVVRAEFRDLFDGVSHDEFDWDAWRPLFEEGFRPESAVRQALSVPP